MAKLLRSMGLAALLVIGIFGVLFGLIALSMVNPHLAMTLLISIVFVIIWVMVTAVIYYG